MKIYLAGPDVFYPDAKEIGRLKSQLCSNHGAIGLYPLDNTFELSQDDVAYSIFLANKDMMDSADCCIANLTPFRGPSADVGTVMEMGYMIGQGKPVFTYTNTRSYYFDRVWRNSNEYGLRYDPDINVWRDETDSLIEDFKLHDNLMIDGFVRHQGFTIVDPNPNNYHECNDLDIFERCVKSCVDNMNFRKRMR